MSLLFAVRGFARKIDPQTPPTPDVGLIAHWKFTETNGTTADDAEDLQNGTYVGSPDLGLPAMVTGGGGFGAKDGQHVTVAHNAAFAINGPWSISVVFQMSALLAATDDRYGILNKSSAAGNGFTIEIIRRSSGSHFVRAGTSTNAAVFSWIHQSNGMGDPISVGTAYRFTMVQRTTGAFGYWLGSEFGPNAVTNGLANNAGTLGIGGFLDPSQGILIPFNGCIGEVRLYNIALTVSEINALPTPQDTIFLRDITNINIDEGTGRLVDLAPFAHPETGILAEAGLDDPEGEVFHDTPTGSSLVLNTSDLPDEEPPSGAARILALTMNQASGDMLDVDLNNHGTVVGSLERQVAGILTGSSFSAAGDGSTARITVPHVSRYANRPAGTAIVDFSVVVWRQRDTNPSVSGNYVIISKDDVGVPGGWSIEEYNDAGTVKLRAYIRNAAGTAVWIGSQQGVGSLATGVAHRIALTYASGTASLWIDDGAAEASQAITGPGLSGNTEDISIFAYNGGLALYDGVIDETLIYDYALTQTEIEALDDPVTIDRGGSPPPAPDPASFTCLLRSTGSLVETHKDLGNVAGSAAFLNMTTGGNARYDVTGTVRVTPLGGSNGITWQGKRNILLADGSGSGASSYSGGCVSGGAFLCDDMTVDFNWNQLYQSSNSPTGNVFVRETTMTDYLFEGVRIHGGWDGFQNGSGTRNTCSDVTLRKWAVTMNRDDAVENDNWWANLVVDDCYVESFTFFSCRNTGFNGSSRINTIQNCLVHDLPCRIDGVADRSPPFFKLNANSVKFNLIDNIFAVTQSSYTSGGDPFGELVTHNKINSSSGNIICWLGGGSYPEPVPSGFTVQTGATAQNTWDDALSDWWDAFPGHRFDFDPEAP